MAYCGTGSLVVVEKLLHYAVSHEGAGLCSSYVKCSLGVLLGRDGHCLRMSFVLLPLLCFHFLPEDTCDGGSFEDVEERLVSVHHAHAVTVFLWIYRSPLLWPTFALSCGTLNLFSTAQICIAVVTSTVPQVGSCKQHKIIVQSTWAKLLPSNGFISVVVLLFCIIFHRSVMLSAMCAVLQWPPLALCFASKYRPCAMK